MATKEPLVPSMIFRSRMTKQSSNVTEQKACSRSLLSSMSLMRTSVITTEELLLCCGTCIREQAQRSFRAVTPILKASRHDQPEIVRLGPGFQGGGHAVRFVGRSA